MADPASLDAESAANKTSAPKDKICPYCGQAFTSSSLGRHLDLYIKEKNPKPPDGIHDVEAIRKLRGSITRRHPRSSLSGRKDSTPTASSSRPSTQKESTAAPTPPDCDPPTRPSPIPKDGHYAVDSTLSKFPFVHRWEATGVINNIPANGSWDSEALPDASKRPALQKPVGRQAAHKAQFDIKQRLADAMDTARAAELALRELISSWRAAKQHIDNNSMPFDFDPLALDFPALTLHCLRPPPTLFSSTQHPTSTSWAVQSPGQREYGALQAHFRDEFRRWKIACASATTAALEELTYPPSGNPLHDAREAVRKAEKAAENLEKQVEEHLQSAYAVWDSLPAPRRQELWILELARSVGRRHKEAEKLKEQHHRLKQENANLRMQIDQLNHLQQSREFKLLPPTTYPIGRDLVSHAYEQGVKGAKTIGFDLEDRHVDLATVVSKSIERWKNVITSTRVSSSGMGAQKPLDPAPAAMGSPRPPQPRSISRTPQQPPLLLPHQQQQPPHETLPYQAPDQLLVASTNCPVSELAATPASNTGTPSVEETSDQDADAEMEDDDGFAFAAASPANPPALPPSQQQPMADSSRQRDLTQHQLQQHQQQKHQLQHQHRHQHEQHQHQHEEHQHQHEQHQHQQQHQHQHQQQHQQQHLQQQSQQQPPQQSHQHRQLPQGAAAGQDLRFMMQNGAGGGSAARSAMAMSRPMPNIPMTAMPGGDLGVAMQSVRGDPMYLE